MTLPIGEVDLGDEDALTLGGRDRGVPGHDLGAGGGSSSGHRADLVARVVREHDDLVATGGGVRHELDLAGDAVLRRGADEVEGGRVGELGGCLHRALVRLVERQDAEELGQEHHLDVLAGRGRNRVLRRSGATQHAHEQRGAHARCEGAADPHGSTSS